MNEGIVILGVMTVAIAWVMILAVIAA